MVRTLVRDYYETTREFTPNARLFLLSVLLSWVGLSVNQVVFNLYLVSGGYAPDFVGGVTSMLGVGMAATALPAGWLADRLGRRACLILGASLLGVALTARALTLAPGLLFTTTLLLGAGQALVTIAASPFMSENSLEFERTHLFSMHFVVVLLGGILGNIMGGDLPALLERHLAAWFGSPLLSYRGALLAGGITSALAVLPLLSIAEAPRAVRAGPRVRARDHAHVLSRLAITFLLVGAGAGLIMPFFNLYFAERFGATAGQIGQYFSVAQVITLVATLAGPLLARRIGKLNAATVLQLCSLPFLVTLGFESHLAMAVFAFWMRSAFMQMSSPLVTSFAMDAIEPELRARAQAIDNMCWYVGWAASSALAGQVIRHLGYEYPYYLTAVFYAASTVFFWWSFRRRELPAPAGAQASAAAPAARADD